MTPEEREENDEYTRTMFKDVPRKITTKCGVAILDTDSESGGYICQKCLCYIGSLANPCS